MSIKVDENDPVGELEPSFPYRDVVIRRNVDMKEFYDLDAEIGRGKFGTVYRCHEKSTGLTLAAKFVGIARREDRRNVEREVQIMRMLQHPRVIQLYDAFEASNVMCVVQELIDGGELFDRVIGDDFILTEKSCTVFVRQICEGIAFIHSKNVLHLDLKPENILCLTRTGNRIKIIDFGLARQYDPSKKLQVLFGTPEFVAPEVVNFDAIGFGTDMWSIGVICYVLLSGLSPFMGETDVETMANVTIAQYDFDDEAFDDISEEAKDFIQKLLVKTKDERYTATQCLSHPWLTRRPPLRISTELETTKDNLIETVERWSSREPSPSQVVTLPPTPPTTPVTITEPALPGTPVTLPDPVHPSTPVTLPDPVLPSTPVTLPDPVLPSTPVTLPDPVLPSKPVTITEPALPMTPDSSTDPALQTTTALPSPPVDVKQPMADPQDSILDQKKNLSDNDMRKSEVTTEDISLRDMKNTEDTQSPSPSKQPKVDLSPIERKDRMTKESPEVKVSTFAWTKKSPTLKSQMSEPARKPSRTNASDNTTKLTTENKFPSKFALKSVGPPTHFNSCIQQGGTSITISKKALNPSPQPKIAGIVLGQTLPRGSDNVLPKKDIPNPKPDYKLPESKPKIITHKIIVEGTDTANSMTAERTNLSSNVSKSKVDNQKRLNPLLRNLQSDRFERRCSDISCFLHDVENTTDGMSLIDEIKKLSSRLFESDLLDESNNNSSSSFLRQIANRGIGPRRQKFRMTNLNRDVPLGSPPPPSNMTYFIPPNPVSHDTYSSQTHSAPQTPRSSPERMPESLNKDVIMRLFDKMEGKSGHSSVDSHTNYIQSSSKTQKTITSVSSK